MIIRELSRYVLLTLTASCLFHVGCGGSSTPPLGEVSGVVTLNGTPVEGALVEFVPEEGRPSSGITDASGKYSLRYLDDVDGAVVGKHTVSITTKRDASGGEGDEDVIEARPEMIPQDYNDYSSLEIEVKSGAQTHDFKLEGERGPERGSRRDEA